MRQPKSYDGSLMKIAKTNEGIVLEWLKSSQREWLWYKCMEIRRSLHECAYIVIDFIDFHQDFYTIQLKLF